LFTGVQLGPVYGIAPLQQVSGLLLTAETSFGFAVVNVSLSGFQLRPPLIQRRLKRSGVKLHDYITLLDHASHGRKLYDLQVAGNRWRSQLNGAQGFHVTAHGNVVHKFPALDLGCRQIRRGGSAKSESRSRNHYDERSNGNQTLGSFEKSALEK